MATGITAADKGKAVAIDATAAKTVKLAGADDIIIGHLSTVEDRVTEGVLIGTVDLKGGFSFPIATGETVEVGDTVIGAGSGEVKAAGSADYTDNVVTEVASGRATVILL